MNGLQVFAEKLVSFKQINGNQCNLLTTKGIVYVFVTKCYNCSSTNRGIHFFFLKTSGSQVVCNQSLAVCDLNKQEL